ncbi:MAG: ATP-binding protein [Defluviitaleaceae bacterium]|nr:ATP-binding protein [Defluviitaleaceae bacterium]
MNLNTSRKREWKFLILSCLSTAALLIISLVVLYLIVTVTVRDTIFDNKIETAQRNKQLYAAEISEWFTAVYSTVDTLADTLSALSYPQEFRGLGFRDYDDRDRDFRKIAERIVEENEYIINTFIGFSDGSIINGSGIRPGANWSATDPVWYSAAAEAGEGTIVITSPYWSGGNQTFTAAVATYLPSLNNVGAVVGVSVAQDNILYRIAHDPVLGGGYRVLTTAAGEIIFHSNPLVADDENMQMFYDIYDPDFIIDSIQNGIYLATFNDALMGDSYFIAASLDTMGWILFDVVPASVVDAPVSQALASIMIPIGILFAVVYIFAMVLFFNISKYKKQHEAEEELRIIVENMPIVAHITNENFDVTICNDEAPGLFGLSNKQEYAENYYSLWPEFQPDGSSSKEKSQHYTNQALKDGKVVFEWMHQTLQGEQVPCEVTLIFTKLKNKGCLLVFLKDLRERNKLVETERLIKDAMKKANDAHVLTQAIVDSAPFIINLWDDSFTLVSTCLESIKMFKISDKEQYIKRSNDFSPEYQPCGTLSGEKKTEYVKQAFSEGYVQFEWQHQTLCKEPIPAEITLVRFEHQDKYFVAEYIADMRTIKAAMEKENQAGEESRAKTRFLARMSHEIRTPMNAIQGISEIELRKTSNSPATEEAFLRIHNSSNLLLMIINDILDMARVESGKMEIRNESYDMMSMIFDTIQLNMLYIGSKKIDFSLEMDENLPANLIGDELRVKQILNNILSNAFKYTLEGSVSMSVGMEKDTDVTLIFTIRDTGFGMTEKQIEGLFNEFSIADERQVEAAKIEGTGLGMGIVHQLIELLGGKMEITSEPGKGSVFVVYIPQTPDGEQILGKESVANLKRLDSARKPLRKTISLIREPMPYGKVLVVDDVEANLYVAMGFLQPYELTIETVDNASEAITKIKAGEEYDIIFMDHMMPETDGIEATRIIRELGYVHPIVALTANTVKGMVDMFMNSGFSGFISKPIDLNQLDSYLVRFIRDKQPAEVIKAANDKMSTVGEYGNFANISDKVMAAVIRESKKAIAMSEAVIGQETIDEKTLKAFTIQAHGIRGAFAGIGWRESSELAGVLEQAGLDGDAETIRKMIPEFLRTLAEIVEKAELQRQHLSSDDTDADPAYLCEQLLAVKEACEIFDIDSADAAISNLKQKKHSQKTAEAISNIERCLLHGNYGEAIDLADLAVKGITTVNTSI